MFNNRKRDFKSFLNLNQNGSLSVLIFNQLRKISGNFKLTDV